MTSDIHIIAAESWIKALNDNGIKAKIISNEVRNDIHYLEYTIRPKKPVESIVIDYETVDGKITFKE